MVHNKAVIFKKAPVTFPVPGEHLTIESTSIDLSQSPPPGGLIVKTNYVSFDPYQRGRMRDASIKSYSPPFDLNKPISNRAIATVISSDASDFAKDDVVVFAMLPTAEYNIISAEEVKTLAKKLDNPYNLDPKIFIGALGMPGLTAYSSFYEIGAPKKGETIFISAASGAVGQLVGQLAKHEGLTVIGSVGDDAKLDYIINECGFDSGFNYKKESPAKGLARLAPEGIDIYYENVGGEHLEAALDALNPFGRIVACGMISQYNHAAKERYGVPNMMNVVGKRIKMQGFIVGDANMGPKYAEEHQKNVQKWISEGKFNAKMSVTHGMDNAIEGLLGLFHGKNFGKAVLEVAPLQT